MIEALMRKPISEMGSDSRKVTQLVVTSLVSRLPFPVLISKP